MLTRKEIFSVLEYEDVFTGFLLTYLVFSTILSSIERLTGIFHELIEPFNVRYEEKQDLDNLKESKYVFYGKLAEWDIL